MFYSEIVDSQRMYQLIADASAPDLDELAVSGQLSSGNSDEIANRVGSIVHNKIIFAILDPIDNPAKTEIAKKIANGMKDPATLQFLVDRLGPGIKAVIRNAFNDALREIEGLRY